MAKPTTKHHTCREPKIHHDIKNHPQEYKTVMQSNLHLIKSNEDIRPLSSDAACTLSLLRYFLANPPSSLPFKRPTVPSFLPRSSTLQPTRRASSMEQTPATESVSTSAPAPPPPPRKTRPRQRKEPRTQAQPTVATKTTRAKTKKTTEVPVEMPKLPTDVPPQAGTNAIVTASWLLF